MAEGEQFAVSVADPPAAMLEGDAVNVHWGGWTAPTGTVTLAVFPVPEAFAPDTEKVVVVPIVAVAVEVVEVALIQVYEVADGLQVAVKLTAPAAVRLVGFAVRVHCGVVGAVV